MRRVAVMIVALGLALSFGACSCPECPECVECAECVCGASPAGDEVSGCEALGPDGEPLGAPLVKAVIRLTGDAGRCEASVHTGKRDELCVMQGGVVRWKVENGCGPLRGDRDTPAIEVADLVDAEGNRADWLENACDARIEQLLDGAPPWESVILCDVPMSAPVDEYKYSLKGLIQTLDPPIRVRPPGP